MRSNDAEERYTETLRESVRAGVSGLAALAPIPVLSVLGAPVGVVLAYLTVLIVVLAGVLVLQASTLVHTRIEVPLLGGPFGPPPVERR